MDQYYLGSHREGWGDFPWFQNQKAGVQYTLDTVVQELAMDPSKRFIQVETAFFWRWWQEQTEETKEMVVELKSRAGVIGSKAAQVGVLAKDLVDAAEDVGALATVCPGVRVRAAPKIESGFQF